ncbi:LTA synthase family protein [Aquibaculum sediminis]|uniref:LTA synthase family protein n=1 Tax=Aquibaculum sediminis TaxID=3231907 RepID=UPI003456749E
MATALVALLVLYAVGLYLERGVAPRPARWRRPPIAYLTFLTVGLAWYALLLGATGRPLLALLISLAGAYALQVVSNAKYALLREPLVFSDFALIPQILRHPRLYYVELLQRLRTWLLIAPVIALLLLWLWLEPVILPAWERLGLIAAAPALLALPPYLPGLGPALRRAAARHLPIPEPEAAAERLGLAAFLLLSFLRWLDTRPPQVAEPLPLPAIAGRNPAPLVVAVQSESFLDLRRLRDDAPALPNLARAQQRALAWGPLGVPAIGAYTMRTEYAFLSATANRAMGFDGLDPYLRADRYPLPCLPRLLSQAGWETLFLHPHAAHFFRRHKVMPALGFRRMVTEEAFPDVERIGPYVSDAALTTELLRQMEEATDPAFIFTVTMENHGPWRPGRLPGLEQEAEIYGQHLVHADAMLGRVLDALDGLDRPWALCFFGDHPPILRSIGDPAPDHRSDYVLLTSANPPADGPRELDAAELGTLLRQRIAAMT